VGIIVLVVSDITGIEEGIVVVVGLHGGEGIWERSLPLTNVYLISIFNNRPDIQKNIYRYLLDILQQLVEESATISQDVIEVILSHFSTKKKTENPARHKLSIDLCNTMSDKLQRCVCQVCSQHLSIFASIEDIFKTGFY
jgi:hypothetical protein